MVNEGEKRERREWTELRERMGGQGKVTQVT